MKIEEHIFRAIEAADRNEMEHALLHACIAIDGTEQKHNKRSKSDGKAYKEFIRKYYWILEPMTGTKINFDETKWDQLALKGHDGKDVKNKDMASVIYHAFRCNQAHGKEIPRKYKLIPRNEDGTLSYHIANDQLNLPETIIWGLISICVLCKTNKGIQTESEHHLALAGNVFKISDWWGLENSFKPIAKKHNQIRVILNGL